MIIRNENGKWSINQQNMEIFFNDLFEICKTEQEIGWLEEQLIAFVEKAKEEAILDL